MLTLFDVTTSTYREGGIGSRETLCHDIYRAWPITTISMAANTYCMMDGHSSSALMTGQHIQEEAICYQWFKQRLILSVPEPSISQRSQVKEDTVELSVPARDFNLKEYAAITGHNDSASLGLEPRLTDHRSQAARTATLPTVPPRQPHIMGLCRNQISVSHE